MTGYIAALLATLPQGTLMSGLLMRVNDFIRHKRWEKRWGNPIRGASEPNPLYGFGHRGFIDGSEAGVVKAERSIEHRWEGGGVLKLMDSGVSNNMPSRE